MLNFSLAVFRTIEALKMLLENPVTMHGASIPLKLDFGKMKDLASVTAKHPKSVQDMIARPLGIFRAPFEIIGKF